MIAGASYLGCVRLPVDVTNAVLSKSSKQADKLLDKHTQT